MAMFQKLLRFGIYLAIFVGGLVCSLYLSSKWIIQSGGEVVVPDLVGHDTVYALDLLTSMGLNIKVGGFMYSEAVPKNFVAFQEPTSGTRLKRDRDVKVIISRGSKSVRVPRLVGTRLREAELVLPQNGLHLGGICRIPSSTYPVDTIIAQRPAALQEMERGGTVDLLLSEGPKSVGISMPELRQRPIGKGLKILDSLGLEVAAVNEAYQPGQPLHTIVGQRPLAGYRVDGDSPIILTVNRLPQTRGKKAKFWWITYRVEAGYFRKEIALRQHHNDAEMLLYRKIHHPGEQLAWLVWATSPGEISVLVDGLLQRRELSGFDWESSGELSYLSSEQEIEPISPDKPWRER
jgi:serine/threonine-protein kinase